MWDHLYLQVAEEDVQFYCHPSKKPSDKDLSVAKHFKLINGSLVDTEGQIVL